MQKSLGLLFSAITLVLTPICYAGPANSERVEKVTQAELFKEALKDRWTKLYKDIESQTDGIQVGPLDASRTVYVFFHPDHKASNDLWFNLLPLSKNIRFVWLPLDLLPNDGSITNQGNSAAIAILSAPSPKQALTENQNKWKASGALYQSNSAHPLYKHAVDAVQTHSQLFRKWDPLEYKFHIPFVIFKNSAGVVDTAYGAGSESGYRTVLGIR